MKDNQYAYMNAALYTALIALILLAPLYVYTVYIKNIHEIQNELFLKQQSSLIISAMEEYDETRESYFEFPRFKRVQSGLYNLNFEPIFTLIDAPMEHFASGYHIDDTDYAYLIVALPPYRYFDADYLIVGNPLSYAPVYQKVMTILLSIVVVVFFLSIFFLNRFALPFKRVNEKLDNFIKDSMHEINTPLSIINVNIDLFNLKNPKNKYLQRIKAATKTLSNIYNDMDYLIKNQQIVFEYQDIDASAFVRERILYFDEVAAMKGIAISADVEDGITLHFNTTQLQRIIDNNISNAIKYSYEESKIEVTLKRVDAQCALIFKDYGFGIEDTNKIFDRYYREETGKGGFGIGLNIVKSIMEETGIELSVQSTPKEGSTFIYTFPASLLKS
ncbi:HAMP domain-containing sensor histidine kinase [Sulfurimonas sp. HSL3-7]|uniref:sensor histidine kinase n=1 Tax=Sulfonitrofixus jiaomeiensis TaxID=3131938 RepID=UPI0031F97F26